jgi:dCMP deaminase
VNDRPDIDETLMAIAALWAQRGTCSRAAVGVVVALEGRIITTGYNGAPSGMPHCVHPTDAMISGSSEVGCTSAVHAEANALAFAAKNGTPTNGATLYTTLTPCVPCAQLIINAGIVRVVAHTPYRVMDGWNLLYDAGLVLDLWELT